MRKIIIFGNSGSRKSTLAKIYAEKYQLSHLDLDTLAGEKTEPPQKKPFKNSSHLINQFFIHNEKWVIEGGYADLLEYIINSEKITEIFFLNPGTKTCVDNCRNRPWEPHKYNSPAEQNSNLNMLIDWVKQYSDREDEFSLKAHQKIFQKFPGNKYEYTSNVTTHTAPHNLHLQNFPGKPTIYY